MKKHILIIDDEAAIRDLLAQFLIDIGYRLTVAASAAEALQVVKLETPDLIISDLQLEDADGLEMIAGLKTILPSTPVICSRASCSIPKSSATCSARKSPPICRKHQR